ncbi:DUF6230 family protein [Streptomyces sp. NPDC051956]|uniref:DUF6230 family protein n=1 Tax=Streptomyces sp. NPDC051956 TaxID=3365677 RepID=UPI0037CF3415
MSEAHRHGRTDGKKRAVVAPPAVPAVGTTASVMAQGAPEASFTVSGTSFQVSSGNLKSQGLSSCVQTDRDADGQGHPVARLGIGNAKLSGIRQVAEVKTPVGTVVFDRDSGVHTDGGR